MTPTDTRRMWKSEGVRELCHSSFWQFQICLGYAIWHHHLGKNYFHSDGLGICRVCRVIAELGTIQLDVRIWPKRAIQGRRSSGRTGVKWKSWDQWKLVKNKKSLPVFLFLFINNGNLKNNNRNYGNHFAFSGCANGCNKIVSSQSR